MKAKILSALATATLIALLMSAQTGETQLSFDPEELIFTVYADGFVAVDYTVAVDPTRARVNITLFGSIYQDLSLMDQDLLPLDYSTINGGLTVDTLGSTTAYVYYVTLDLTGKAGQVWTFTASPPIPSSILLPEEATIIDLNIVPLEMGILDGCPFLTMPAGNVEVAYTIDVVGTREHALILIKDAESTISGLKARGIFAPEAEALLQQAYDAFDAERFAEAEQYAEQAKTSALSVGVAESTAKEAIIAASTSISAARNERRTEGLNNAEELLKQAEEAYDARDYADAEDLADQAKAAAAEATTPRTPISWTAIAVVAAAAMALAFYVFILRKEPTVVEPTVVEPTGEETGRAVDLDSLFEKRPHLRFDDREALRFLAEAGGEAFATEIRERFDIPRTTAWRMIRRLQREGIVEVSNVGGQSLVRIKPEHRR